MAKAFLLCAGLGTRLRSLTTKPKCLIEVKGKPLLDYWLHACGQTKDITKAFISMHYEQQQIKDFMSTHKTGLPTELLFEPKILGTAGTIVNNLGEVENESEVIVIYGDNYSNINLNTMLAFHREKKSSFTLVVLQTNTPKEKGIITLDADNKIISFVEKPAEPTSNLMNGGIYILDPKVMTRFINDFRLKGFLDFGFDVLPRLLNEGATMYAYQLKEDEFLIDVGLPQDYEAVVKR